MVGGLIFVTLAVNQVLIVSRQCFIFKKLHGNCQQYLLIPQECLCINDLPDCNITHYNVTAYPGETFQIPAVAVGQMFGTVPITVHTSFISASSSSPPQMKLFQGTQQLQKHCTNLTYTIASSHQSENMILTVEKLDKEVTQYILQYPDRNKLPLVLQDLRLHIQLKLCPLGFWLYNSSCTCHHSIE